MIQLHKNRVITQRQRRAHKSAGGGIKPKLRDSCTAGERAPLLTFPSSDLQLRYEKITMSDGVNEKIETGDPIDQAGVLNRKCSALSLAVSYSASP